MTLLRHLITALSALATITVICLLAYYIWKMVTDPQPLLHAQTIIRILSIYILANSLHSHLSRS